MERTNRKLRVCAVLIALNLVIIWGNSLLPGSVSGAISRWVRDLFAAILPGGSVDPDSGHGLLRKLAHFTEFACLGGLLTWLFAMLHKPRVLALVCGFTAGSVDETIQRFVPDRGPSFVDVLIDTSGTVLGIILVLAGYAIYQKKKAKQFLEDTKREKMVGIASGNDNDVHHGSLRQKENGSDGESYGSEGQSAAGGHHGGEY